jgi:hypothetical protein
MFKFLKKRKEKRYIGIGVNIKALDAISTTPAYKTKEEINKLNYPIIIEIELDKKETL